MNTLSVVFFGTPQFSATILDHLKESGLTPKLIVTAPDKKVGRKQILTPPEVKVWGQTNGVRVLQPVQPGEITDELKSIKPDLFIVAAYGYILKKDTLNIPRYGTLNVHTSLLPKYRGASPIESAILAADKTTGSTIMLMDEKMDHGPILSQETFLLNPDINRIELFEMLANHGGSLLARTIPRWVDGSISPQEQNHQEASFCYKIEKDSGNITEDDNHTRYRKYLAFWGWPGVFYIDTNSKRVKVTKARFENGVFIIERIIPEGKNEMNAN